MIDEAFTQHRQWRETQNASREGGKPLWGIAYQNWTVGFKSRITQSIQQWIGRAGYEAGKLLRSLRDKAEQWWYFHRAPEVPPDNNQAERSLRLAVTKRKVGGGSRSMQRFAQTADLLDSACFQQFIDLFASAFPDSLNLLHLDRLRVVARM